MGHQFFKNVDFSVTYPLNNKIDNLSQDVHNCSLTAPSVVAWRAEPKPDRPSLAPYSDGLEGNLGGPAASEVPTGMDSPTQIEFGVFLARVRELEFQHGYLPDSFLTSLRGKVIYAADHSLFLSGDSIADSVRSYCLRVFDHRSPAPCPSRDGNSITPFVCSLLGVPVSSPSVALGDSDACSLRVSFAFFPSFFSFPVTSVSSVTPNFSLPFAAASSLSASSFPGLVAGSLLSLVASYVSWPVTSSVASCVAPAAYPVSWSFFFLLRSSCRLASRFLVRLVSHLVCCWFVGFVCLSFGCLSSRWFVLFCCRSFSCLACHLLGRLVVFVFFLCYVVSLSSSCLFCFVPLFSLFFALRNLVSSGCCFFCWSFGMVIFFCLGLFFSSCLFRFFFFMCLCSLGGGGVGCRFSAFGGVGL